MTKKNRHCEPFSFLSLRTIGEAIQFFLILDSASPSDRTLKSHWRNDRKKATPSSFGHFISTGGMTQKYPEMELQKKNRTINLQIDYLLCNLIIFFHFIQLSLHNATAKASAVSSGFGISSNFKIVLTID